MNIKYKVTLSEQERDDLTRITRGGKGGARIVRRAQIVLAAARNIGDEDIATACATSTSTVYRTKRRFVEEGMDAVLSERPRTGAMRLLDLHAEAKLTAIACSDPPAGRSRWTLQLLADRLVCLTDVESVSLSTICRRLKDSDLKPWRQKMWCIPKIDAEYVARMEDILDLYASPVNPTQPVICFDEKPVQMVGEVRTALPMEPGKPRRYDSEYVRGGTANLFVFLNANEPWRHVKPTKHRRNSDFAHCMRDLVDQHCPGAELIHVVLDNLSTHKPAALYETFPAEEARRILRRLQFHYTPKHASWLNMVEIENGVIQTQCLDRRISDFETLINELEAWQKQRNKSGARIHWRFTVDKAREKMHEAYPTCQNH